MPGTTMTFEQVERLRTIDDAFSYAEERGLKLTQVLSSKQIRFLRELVEPVSVGAVDPVDGVVEGCPRASESLHSLTVAAAPAPKEEA